MRHRTDVELLVVAAADLDGGRLSWSRVGAEGCDAGIAGDATAVVHLNALGAEEDDHGRPFRPSVAEGRTGVFLVFAHFVREPVAGVVFERGRESLPRLSERTVTPSEPSGTTEKVFMKVVMDVYS